MEGELACESRFTFFIGRNVVPLKNITYFCSRKAFSV